MREGRLYWGGALLYLHVLQIPSDGPTRQARSKIWYSITKHLGRRVPDSDMVIPLYLNKKITYTLQINEWPGFHQTLLLYMCRPTQR